MKSGHESLFCQDEPNCCFAVQACGHCELCSTSGTISTSCRYTFRNGYQTILNANAICTTRNIIFVLQCLCQEYEYVGETSGTLGQALADIRPAMMRYIHEQLLGQPISNASVEQARLYQHLSRCPAALQAFLDRHPSYWRFVPMATTGEAKSIVLSKNRSKRKEEQRLDDLIKRLPLAPQGYRFTAEQQDQQRRFFRRGDEQRLPSPALDLVRAMILVVGRPTPLCSPSLSLSTSIR